MKLLVWLVILLPGELYFNLLLGQDCEPTSSEDLWYCPGRDARYNRTFYGFVPFLVLVLGCFIGCYCCKGKAGSDAHSNMILGIIGMVLAVMPIMAVVDLAMSNWPSATHAWDAILSSDFGHFVSSESTPKDAVPGLTTVCMMRFIFNSVNFVADSIYTRLEEKEREKSSTSTTWVKM